MPVSITCPVCGHAAQVVTGGKVIRHEGLTGLCHFVQTASSSRPASNVTPPVVTPAMELKRERMKAQYAAKQASAKKRAETRKARAKVKYECPRCLAPVAKSKGGILVAHTRPNSSRWCSGGAEPTDTQRGRKTKTRRSIWTVSGGLPGQGRRG